MNIYPTLKFLTPLHCYGNYGRHLFFIEAEDLIGGEYVEEHVFGTQHLPIAIHMLWRVVGKNLWTRHGDLHDYGYES